MWTFLCSLPLLMQLALLITSLIGCLKAYVVLTMGVCKSTNKLTGKTVIITGANTGIGKETAIDLAKRGARVILACRDIKKAFAAKDEIIRESGNDNVVVHHLDLSSLKSVRKFSADIVKSEPRLDILINNAGCIVLEKKLTEDGLEYQMQTNYFGHFLLTNLLLGLLKKSAPSRIINTSSIAHSMTKTFDLNNLNSELSCDDNNEFYNAVYCYSKLSQVLSTRHLAPIISEYGVTVNSLCPGPVKTEIFRNSAFKFKILAAILVPFIFKTAKQGAQTTIHLAVADEVSGITGEFFTNCKIAKMSQLAMDVGLAKKLWEMSETFVNLQPEERHY